MSIADELAGMPRQYSNDYPLWQGPCGPGWNGGITQSMLGNFLSCRERFRLKNILGLVPHDKWNHKMGYGTMWHVCEEQHAAQQVGSPANVKSWQHALEEYTTQQAAKYQFQREEIWKWYTVCRIQFQEYVTFWQDHPDVKTRTPLLQEVQFDVPYTLPSGRVVRLRGKWDSVDLIPAHTDDQGRQWPTGIWLQENKTKGDIDQVQVERQLSFDLQTMVYLIALRETKSNGNGHYRWERNPILGVRYNVVRRPLSGGKGSIKPHQAKQNKAKGTYTPAETEEHFYERLRADYIAKEPEYWFFRVRAGISEQDIKVFKDTCLDPLLETVCFWYDRVIRKPVDSNSNWQALAQSMNYRTPFGIYSPLEEGESTEYDHCLATGSESTLRRVMELFPELK